MKDQYKDVYILKLKTKQGFVSDEFEFDSSQEAKAEMIFCQSFYGPQYDYELVKERRNIKWKRSK